MIRRIGGSLAAKLVAAQLLVIIAGSATLAIVALLVAPGIYHSHVQEALGTVPEAVSDHLDRAFEDAMVVALGIAIGAAILTAATASGFLALRLLRPIRAMAEGARRISAGDYDSRVPANGTDELAVLAGCFNEMASSLRTAERRRRELISDVAHEFRTPLATLEGYVEGMADGTLPRSDENLDVLAHETRRLARLLDDLSRVSLAEERQLDLRLAEIETSELVTISARAAAPAYAEKDVRLDVQGDGPSAPVIVDADRIGEVLGNLLANALRHTPPRGTVEIGWWRGGDHVEIVVADTGEGIAPEHLQRIFERFYRVDRARARASGGSGIGLTIARAIVEAHGGRLSATSGGRGHGARLTVRLPLAGAPSGAASV